MSKSKRKPTREQIIARGQFETLKNLMQTYAGYRAKEPDMQRVYSTFPDFEFDTLRGFGEYFRIYTHKTIHRGGLDMGIKQRREALGLTQATLAQRLGVDRSTVSKWESGAAYPSIKALLALSAELQTTTTEVLEAIEQAQQEQGGQEA